MKCVQCGTENVNEMLVSFIAEDEFGIQYEDTTILPKSLYYFEHPTDKRKKSKFPNGIEEIGKELGIVDKGDPFKIVKVRYYSCANCHSDKTVEGKKSVAGLRIHSRKYGI